jgi:hypothetical protein
MKFSKKPSLNFPKFSSSENKPSDSSPLPPTSSSAPSGKSKSTERGYQHPPSDDSGQQQEEQINQESNETEKHSKLKFPSGLSSIDLDPLRVKDQMGRLSGKMKSSLNKISEKIPVSKRSSNDGDEFDKVIQKIENKNIESSPLEFQNDGEQQEGEEGEQEGSEPHKTKSVVAQITNVKGKLNKLGMAAKQRLSSIHHSTPFGAEENDSAHSSASKDSNSSLTATARLSRAFPVLLQSTSTTLDNSSGTGTPSPRQTSSAPCSNPSSTSNLPDDSHMPPSVILAEELLEMWIDVDKEDKDKDETNFNSTPRLSRRPSEYLEFENTPSSTAPPLARDSSAPLPRSNSTDNGTTSHTPFLYPKVKKMGFLKSSPSPSSTPPLPLAPASVMDPNELSADEADPYYQPYGSHHHPPSLSKLPSLPPFSILCL